MPARLLVIDATGGVIRLLDIKKEGRRIKPLWAETAAPLTSDISGIARAIASLRKKDIPGKVIFITDQVRFLLTEMDIPKEKKLPEERLKAAIAWEMEPYLDFPQAEGIFNYRMLLREAGPLPFLITAIHRNIYTEIERTFKDLNLTLIRVYAPEACLAFAGGKKVIINCEKNLITGAFLRQGGLPAFQSLPVGSEDLVETTIRDILRGLMLQDVPEEIVLCGSKASEEIAARLEDEIGLSVRPFEAERDLMMVSERIEPAYALATMAAAEEFGAFGPPLGITTRIPLTRQIVENIHFLPAAILLFTTLTFLSHFAYIKIKTAHCASEIKRLEEKKTQFKEMKEKKTQLTKKQAELTEKKRYLEHLPVRQKNLLLFLKGIGDVIPDTVILEKMTQEGDTFLLKGHSVKGKDVPIFARSLSGLKPCKDVKVKTFERSKAKDRASFDFNIEVILKGV